MSSKGVTGEQGMLRRFELFVESRPGCRVIFAPQDMRWFWNLLKSLFSSRTPKAGRHELLGMYFGESNHTGGRRKPNRDRA